jgi:hypothetical protein
MNMYEDRVYGIVYVGWYVILDITFLLLTVFITTSHKRLCTFLFHLGFTFWISLWVGEFGFKRLFAFGDGGVEVIWPHFEWPLVFAALAAILHLVALLKGDDIVLSRTLGGEIEHGSEVERSALMNDERSPLL